MIIFDNAFYLTESEATLYPLKNARIGYQTWLRDLPIGAATASSTRADSTVDAPLRPDTAEFWAPTALPATWTVDMGATRNFDYVGIAGHTLGSSGCSVAISSGDDGITFAPFAPGAAPLDDAPLLFLDEVENSRYVKLTITGGAVMPIIASIYVGLILKMQRPIYGGISPITLSRDTVLSRSLSVGGQFLNQGFRRHGVDAGVQFRHLTADWYRDKFDPFVKSARRYPYFFAWRPDKFPTEVAYAWTGKDIQPSNMGVRDFMSVAWSMQGIGHE